MGNCVGVGSVEENTFKVTNINDNKSLVQRGVMEVTPTELIYTDSKTKDDWHWPLKFLRKYGCDGDVFTFEAGRKCPGGEGLYAFSTKKANILFEIVARNINQGNLQPSGELSPFSEPQAPISSVLDFPPRRTSAASPTHHPQDLPSYTNLELMGNHIENGNHVGPPSPAATSTPDPKKFVYREVVFDRPPDDHPKPSGEPAKQTTSYTQIDFDQTQRLSDHIKAGARVMASNAPHARTSSTSTTMSGNISPTKSKRKRVHTYTSGSRDRQVSRSESSFSSQSSLTESSRDVRSPPKSNGGVPRASLSDPASSTYQNLHVGTIPEQQQYQNVHVGAGDVGHVFDTTSPQLANYCNVNVAAGGAGGGVSPVPMESGRSHIKVNGDSMTTYAQLDISSDKSQSKKKSRSMSSSAATHTTRDTSLQSSYLQLDFQKGGGGGASASVVPQPTEDTPLKSNKRSASVGTAAAASPGPAPSSAHATITTPTTGQDIPEEIPTQSNEVVDETKVIYHALNFAKMDALTQLAAQREQEIEQEREQRERERANTHNKKKK